MDDEPPEPDTTSPSQDRDRDREPRTVLERFLARLFSDRFLTHTPAATEPPPPTPHPAILTLTAPIPFFGAAAQMSAPPEHVVFCVEDTVGLKDDKFSVGVVDRSFGDVDSHTPRPQRDYGEDLERHDDISREEFAKFMRTGIPPRGSVLVSWQTQLKTELIPEARLQLLDRALYVGGVVKRNAKDPVSGTVIGTKAVCTLFPATMFNGGQLTHSMTEDLSIRGIPADELINVHEYIEGALVVYEDWIGRIEQVYDDVAVKLSDNSVVVVEDPDDLEPDDALIDRLSVGDTAKTKKGNLRRGRWRYGAFDPNVRPHGMVVETRPAYIDVHWLTRRIGGNIPGSQNEEPPPRLYDEQLENPNFYIYDATRAAAATLPVSADGTNPSYHVAEVTVGDRVRFKDLTGAAVKYDGSRNLPNGYPQGKLSRISRTETLGYDMNVFLVMQTHTQVTVQWQDLSITEDTSSSLIPDPNVEDDDEVWPGEIVCTKEQRECKSGDVAWTFRPAKVGIVQAVKSRDRIATVQWFENPTIQFLEEDLIPPSETGKLCDTTEDVSLYDIRSTPSLTRRRGDFVLIHPDTVDTQALPHNLQGPNWFGEVIDLGLDGKLTVRLGAAKPVIDIRIPIERVTLAYSSDMDSEFLSMAALDGGTDEDYESGDEDVDFDSASFNEMWIEYEGMDGEPVDGADDGEWSTEDEDEDFRDDDTPMEDADTSNTTPEAPANEFATQGRLHTAPTSLLAQPDKDASQTPSGIISPPPETATTNTPTSPLSSFLILDTEPPTSHHYLRQTTTPSSTFTRRIAKEHKILSTSLPPNIFVRTWDSRLDLLRVLLIGPSDTPYEYAPFVIDFQLPSTYPSQPPLAYFHSWTNGNGPVNPNLYEDGKICLSLLGTWHADERNEEWSPGKSTLLQVLVSIMGLVLVKEPYYNEAGYDVHREAPETKLNSSLYTERAYFRARAFIVHVLEMGVEPFESEIHWLYRGGEDEGEGRGLLRKAITAARGILERSSEGGVERDGLRSVSLGAAVMLKRQVERLEALWDGEGRVEARGEGSA